MLALRQIKLKHAWEHQLFPEDCVITLYAADVSKTIKQVNIHKASLPGGAVV